MAIPIGTVSYAAAAAAFLFLFVLLVTSWRGRLQGMLLAFACLVTALWAAAGAYLESGSGTSMPGLSMPGYSMQVVEVLEVLRSAVWFGFLLVLLGYSRSAIHALRAFAAGLAGLCVLVLAVTLYSSVAGPGQPGWYGILGRLVLAVMGLVLVEQLYRNVLPQRRWGIKFLCLGLLGMFGFDFYLYSDALLFRRVSDGIWEARGIVNAFVVPLLAVAAARNPNWSLDIFVSRRVLFHSSAMLGAAAYLLVMAAAGYYIRYFGGSWGAILQVTFLFGALLLLALILFSGTLRARLKVFLSKNFFSYHYDYREEWLRFTRTLSEGEPGVQLRERSIEAISELVDSPGGALWLSQDAGAFERVAHWNMPAAQGVEQAGGSLCQFLEKRQWVVNLDEYQTQPELYDGLALPDWLRDTEGAWLVVPLILHERLLGFVVLARSMGKVNLNWEVSDLLKTAGRQAASYLAQLEAARALLVARQFESFNRMSAFVVHDLKNLVAQLSLLLANAEKHKHKPAFQADMLETVAHSVEKMNRLLFQLRGGYALGPAAPVALAGLLAHAVASRAGFKPAPRLEEGDPALSVVAHRTRLESVIGHLIQNAVDATPPDGHVVVTFLRRNGSAVIEIADDGCGRSAEFIRDRLFRPFESTKSSGMGIGTFEARQYVAELGGVIEVSSGVSRGTTFRVVLPRHVAERSAETGVAAEGVG